LTRRFRYPALAMIADFARATAGLLCTLVPILFLQPAGPIVLVLAAAAALFLVYFTRTVLICLSSIELDETGMRARGPRGASIPWEELRLVRLQYFTTRNDREQGWLQLQIHGARGRIEADSRIEGFAELARAAAGEAGRRGLALDPYTLANLEALDGARR
jgi:hypothetical protein